eukprot:s2525_g7.t1
MATGRGFTCILFPLVFVVPFMPATHAIEATGPHDLGRVSQSLTDKDDEIFRKRSSVSLAVRDAYVVASRSLKNIFGREEKAPLHVFEHTMKVPVDFGMFFFGLANAGVKLGSIGGITGCVGLSLVVGKTVGIAAMSAIGPLIGAPLPKGLGMVDLIATAALGGVGLTVALFVANEAFVEPEMRGQAKMGAVLSTGCGALAWLIKMAFGGIPKPAKPEQNEEDLKDRSVLEEEKPQIHEDDVGIFCKGLEVRKILTDNSQNSNAHETSCRNDKQVLTKPTCAWLQLLARDRYPTPWMSHRTTRSRDQVSWLDVKPAAQDHQSPRC